MYYLVKLLNKDNHILYCIYRNNKEFIVLRNAVIEHKLKIIKTEIISEMVAECITLKFNEYKGRVTHYYENKIIFEQKKRG